MDEHTPPTEDLDSTKAADGLRPTESARTMTLQPGQTLSHYCFVEQIDDGACVSPGRQRTHPPKRPAALKFLKGDSSGTGTER